MPISGSLTLINYSPPITNAKVKIDVEVLFTDASPALVSYAHAFEV